MVTGAATLLLVAAGTYYLTHEREPVEQRQFDASKLHGSGPLDGMTFSGVIGTPAKPNRTKDKFVFSNGKFVSSECVKICGYQPGSYFIREQDGKTEFLSVSRCDHKDAKIEWRGTIEDGVIKGESVWTVNRWYRTIEKKLLFKGKLVESTTPVSGN